MGISRNRISEIAGNGNFAEIGKLLKEGRDMEYIADHYHIDMTMAWALRLEKKSGKDFELNPLK